MKTIERVKALEKALKKCEPIKTELLRRLYVRIGISQN